MIPEDDFAEILKELERHPLQMNNYRVKSGDGRSQAFGLVNRRCLLADYSRQCWLRPYLYKLLLDFAEKHVKIPFTSITVNQNYRAEKHRDKGNVGESFLVAFGNYTGGELRFHEGPREGLHNIRHNPIVEDFSKTYHSVEPYQGNRYSIVFYTLKRQTTEDLPPPSVRMKDNKYVFYRGEEECYGLPHPLRGRKKS